MHQKCDALWSHVRQFQTPNCHLMQLKKKIRQPNTGCTGCFSVELHGDSTTNRNRIIALVSTSKDRHHYKACRKNTSAHHNTKDIQKRANPVQGSFVELKSSSLTTPSLALNFTVIVQPAETATGIILPRITTRKTYTLRISHRTEKPLP